MRCSIVVDFGNSDTKVIVVSGKRVYRGVVPNQFAELDEDMVINSAYYADSTFFRLNTPLLSGRFASGKYVTHEAVDSILRPTALARGKSRQATTRLAFCLAVLFATKCLTEELGVSSLSSLDVHVVALLPPAEENEDDTTLHSMLSSIKEVVRETTKKLTHVISLRLESVYVVAEGFAGVISTAFLPDGSLDSKYSSLMSGYTLVVDIGAGTTDLVLLRDGELVQGRRGESPAIGGNTVHAALQGYLLAKYNFKAPADVVEDAIKTGYVRKGKDVFSCVDLLNRAKRDYFQKLRSELMVYLERYNFDMRNLTGVVLVGGGSLSSTHNGEETTKSMSSQFVSFFRELMGTDIPVVLNPDPRWANINGALILARLLKKLHTTY